MGLGLLLLLLVGVIAWKLAVPGEEFLSGFARLLTDPQIKRGAFSFFSGRSYATGRWQGRQVALRLQLKRSRYGQGYLVIALRTDGMPALDDNGIETRVQDEAGRRALYAIVKHDFVLGLEEGWLRALWKPQGFIIFPGRFSEEKWREVLEAMQMVATSFERAAEPVRQEGS